LAVVGASEFLFLKNLDIMLASFSDLAGIGRGILSILAREDLLISLGFLCGVA